MKPILFIFLMTVGLSACAESPLPVEEAPEPAETEAPVLQYPIEDFPERVTLKPFGIRVSPGDSPVQPERFSGFHTGADAEATESEQNIDVWVSSIAEGTVRLARSSDGYGGVLVIEHFIDGESFMAVYGHIDLGSLQVAVEDTVDVGQPLALLGDGYSEETDGERKHLHFALMSGSTVNLKGYVQSEAELLGWIDPAAFFQERL